MVLSARLEVSLLVGGALVGGVLLAGCNRHKKSDHHAWRSEMAAAQAAAVASDAAADAALTSRYGGGGLVSSADRGLSVRGAPVLTGGSTSGPGGPPATGNAGSPYWYVGDTLGNEFKTHTSEEAAQAQALFALIDDERRKAGLALFVPDGQAELAAKVHAEDMGGRRFFSHVTPEGWTPQDRLQMLGASGYRGAAENIAQAPSADVVMQAWLGSPGHRANLLSPNLTHAGVGFDQDSRSWVLVLLQR